ncbi:MAG TPA: hypothetical protein PLQ00_12865, partial [Thermoguttaceae bacterium]|nr:hypothetical protein [Thermoguttaceae bacterium]
IAGGVVVGGEIFRLFGPGEWTGGMSLAGGNAETATFGGLATESFSWGFGGLGVVGGGMVLLAILTAAGAWKWMTQEGIGTPGGSLFGAWAIAAGAGLVLEILRTEGFLPGLIVSRENSPSLAMLVGMLAPPWAAAVSVGCRRLRFLRRRTLLP